MVHGVPGAIQGVAGVVGHAAVHGHIALVAGNALDGADGVQGHARVRHNAPPRLHQHPGQGKGVLFALLPQPLGHFGNAGRDILLLLALQIAGAVASAQIQLLKGKAQLVPDLRHKADHDIHGALENILFKHLGAHMAVHAPDLKMLQTDGPGDEVLCLAGLHRHAELGVHHAGVHRVVGVGVDARRDAQQHLLLYALLPGFPVQGQKLLLIVHHKNAHPGADGVADVAVRLGIAVKTDVLRRKTGAEGGVDLPGGDRVHAHALLGHDAVHLLEGGRLAGVKGQGIAAEAAAKCLKVHAAVAPYAFLVHQVQRRAVLLRKARHIVAGKGQAAAAAANIV